MLKIKQSLFILLIAVTITNCNNINSTPESELHFEGQVTHMDIEGGFWAIQADEDIYEPTNLPSEFKRDGLDVTVSANIEENVGSIRMVGPVIHIVDIEER